MWYHFRAVKHLVMAINDCIKLRINILSFRNITGFRKCINSLSFYNEIHVKMYELYVFNQHTHIYIYISN